MGSLLTELGPLCGLSHYPNRGAFDSKEGMTIGVKDGFIVAVGIATAGYSKQVAVLLRGAAVANKDALKTALSQTEAMKRVARGAISVAEDSVTWKFGKPLGLKAEKLAAALEAMITSAAAFVSPLRRGACEQCTSSAPMLLVNGIPRLLCEEHRKQLAQQQSAEAAAYENSPPNLSRGVLFAAVAALACVLAWGFGAAWLDRWWNGMPLKILLVMPFALAFVVAKATQVGMGKVNAAGIFTAAAFTAIAVFGGDLLYIAQSLGMERQIPLDNAFRVVFANLLEIKWGRGTEKLITASQVLCIFVAGSVYKALKPKFQTVFEPLGTSSVLTSAPAALK